MARRIARVVIPFTSLAPGSTIRPVINATAPINVATFTITTDNTKSDDKRLAMTVQAGTTPGTLASAATPANLEPIDLSGVAVYGSSAAIASGEILSSPYVNTAAPYGNTIGRVIESGESVQFVMTWPGSATNTINGSLEVVMETI